MSGKDVFDFFSRFPDFFVPIFHEHSGLPRFTTQLTQGTIDIRKLERNEQSHDLVIIPLSIGFLSRDRHHGENEVKVDSLSGPQGKKNIKPFLFAVMP